MDSDVFPLPILYVPGRPPYIEVFIGRMKSSTKKFLGIQLLYAWNKLLICFGHGLGRSILHTPGIRFPNHFLNPTELWIWNEFVNSWKPCNSYPYILGIINRPIGGPTFSFRTVFRDIQDKQFYICEFCEFYKMPFQDSAVNILNSCWMALAWLCSATVELPLRRCVLAVVALCAWYNSVASLARISQRMYA